MEKCNRPEQNWNTDLGYNIKQANWPKFREQIDLNFSDEFMDQRNTLPADKAIRAFNKKLEICCQRPIPKRKVADRIVPWWNQELTDLTKKSDNSQKAVTKSQEATPC